MRLTIETKEKDHVKFYLEDEDVAVADIIHQELLPEQGVVFAAASPVHPLVKRVAMAVRTKTKDPLETLSSCSEKVIGKIDDLIREAKEALSGS